MRVDQPLFNGVVGDALARGESVCLRVHGGSMLPWLREGQKVRVVPAAGRRIRRGDVVLFRRAPDRPVLHRVVASRRNGDGVFHACLGDAEDGAPEWVSEADVLGVVALSPWRRAAYRGLHRPRRWINRLLTAAGIRFGHA